MKRMLLLLLCLLLSGCTALPAEERSFAVALGVDCAEQEWTAYARIPTYQTGGGYVTVSGTGDTLEAALSALDAASPMQLQLGQLRLVVFSARLARSEAFSGALDTLSARHDLRMDAYAVVTAEGMQSLMDALKPATGARLSKSLDVLMETRIKQGTTLPSVLADVLRMGERPQAVLANIGLDGGEAVVSGGWPLNADGRASQLLTPEETQLLALMTGQLTQGTLTLAEGVVRLTSVQVETELALPTMQEASIRLLLRVSEAPLTEKALSHAVATACLGLLNRLSAMGYDALGLGRQAITHVNDMAEWHELDWPTRYRDMDWSVSAGVEGETQ